MTFDPAAEPFASLRASDPRAPDETEFDEARRFTGMSTDDLAAVGMIASYAGQIESNLAWTLRWLIGGATPETWIVTRELMARALVERIREVMKLAQWLEFAERWQVETVLREVQEAMEGRNRVLHGGVSGASVLDQTVVGLSVRRNPKAMGTTSFYSTHHMARTELRGMAVRLSLLNEVVFGLAFEVMYEIQAGSHSAAKNSPEPIGTGA
jgi:hypothetical protein